MITIRPNTAAMQAVVEKLGRYKRGIPVGVQAAISRTITTGVARIARLIGDEVNLPIRTIKNTIMAKRGSYRDLKGTIDITRTKAVWLSEYARGGVARMVGKKLLVRVKVRKRRPLAKYPESIPGAFATSGITGRLGLFQRTGVKRPMKKGRHVGKIREVIRRLRGPTPLAVFENAIGEQGKTILQQTLTDLSDILLKNLLSQLQRFEAKGK